jgi:acetylglutamate kinase
MALSKTAIFKVGGDILLAEHQWRGLGANLAYLHKQGWRCVVLHGGGPQVNSLQESLGIKPNKIAGRRITTEQDLLQVKQAIVGEVNVQLCNYLQLYNLSVLGTHGATGIIRASKRPPIPVSGVEGLVDFGSVGDVNQINTTVLDLLLDANFIPVIATLGRNNAGDIFNINADTTAVAIARAMNADLLCMVTGVGGIYTDLNDPGSLINPIDERRANKLIQDGIIVDGMIAKVQEALSVVKDGVGQVVITSLAMQENMQRLVEDPDNYTLGTRIIP